MDRFFPHDSLGLLVKRAQQALRGALDDALSDAGITTAQYATLTAVEVELGLSNAALARRVFVTPQTMHGLVRGLEKAGWVERGASGGRGVEILLTESGRSVLAQGHRAALEVERRMTGGLQQTDLDVARAVLLGCCDALEAV